MNDTVMSRWKARAAAAEENRRAMPTVTQWIDFTRHIFGEQARVLWAREGERSIGADTLTAFPARGRA